MAPNESAALTELTQEFREFVADFRVFRTKLMGDDEEEDAQGRIPRMEAELKNHNSRLVRLERLTWKGTGAVVALLAISALMQFLYHTVEIFKH
jgi:hypothetical protein